MAATNNSAQLPVSYEKLAKAKITVHQFADNTTDELNIGQMAIESSTAVSAADLWRLDFVWLVMPVLGASSLAVFALAVYGAAVLSAWLYWILSLMLAYGVCLVFFAVMAWLNRPEVLHFGVWLVIALAITQSILLILWTTVYYYLHDQSLWFWWTVLALLLLQLLTLANGVLALVNWTYQAKLASGHVTAARYNYKFASELAASSEATGTRIGLGYVEFAHIQQSIAELKQRQLHIHSPMEATARTMQHRLRPAHAAQE